jgi:hypothetical protein
VLEKAKVKKYVPYERTHPGPNWDFYEKMRSIGEEINEEINT